VLQRNRPCVQASPLCCACARCCAASTDTRWLRSGSAPPGARGREPLVGASVDHRTPCSLKLSNGRAEVLAGAAAVLDESATQEDVFASVAELVSEALQGRNATCFAYGQTGTGKTYTMLGRESPSAQPGGAPSYAVSGPARGVVPRAVEALLAGAQQAVAQGWSTRVRCLYLQQYGERLYDLLKPLPSAVSGWARDNAGDKAMAGLELRPTANGCVVSGCESVEISSMEQVSELLSQGAQHRALRCTALNDASSRSHAILQLIIQQTHRGGGERGAKLNLVDLAGSEKWSTSELRDAPPQRVAELCAINASLSALGACVRALGEPGRQHVPFRDSKLTRLLADSLAGSSRTLLLATLSPSSLAFDESCSTLRFADAASRMLVVQRAPGDGEGGATAADPRVAAARAQTEVVRLQGLLRSLTGEGEERGRLEAENARLKAELVAAQARAKAAAATAAAAQRAAAAAAAKQRDAERAAAAAESSRPPPALRKDSSSTPVDRRTGAIAAQERLSSGWRSSEDGEDEVLSGTTVGPLPSPSPSPSPSPTSSPSPSASASASASAPSSARRVGAERGRAGWLTEYAAQKRAAAAAAAAARGAAASSLFARPLTATQRGRAPAWEEAPFHSRRAPSRGSGGGGGGGGAAVSPLRSPPHAAAAAASPGSHGVSSRTKAVYGTPSGASHSRTPRGSSPVGCAPRIPHCRLETHTPPQEQQRASREPGNEEL